MGAEMEKVAHLESLKGELQAYERAHKLRGLEGRMKAGLDPAAMLALGEVRSRAQKVAEAVGADMTKLDDLTARLHVGAVWTEAGRLATAEDPEAKAWHVLAQSCLERNTSMAELDGDGFLADIARVVGELEAAAADPNKITEAIRENTGDARSAFTMEDGVAYAEGEYPYLKMAIAGETSGVWFQPDPEKGEDLYFVASTELDFDGLANKGYEKTQREDRGRMVTFWQKDGQDVVKQLSPGFGIVLNKDRQLAVEIARTGHKE